MSLYTAYTILLSSPLTLPREECICYWWGTSAIYLSMGSTMDSDLMLLCLSYPCADVLSIYVNMCTRGIIHGAKMSSCSKRDPRSRSSIVISYLGFSNDTKRCCVAGEISKFQTNHCQWGLRQMPTVSLMVASIDPNQLGGKG